MFVTAHARARLADRLGLTAGHLIADVLEARPGLAGHVAIEVAREPAYTAGKDGSNGDQVIVIARDGSVETVMLRRSWNQPFTPSALGVDTVERMA